jgi:hypothetical protein
MSGLPVQKERHVLKKLLSGICLMLAGFASSADQASSGFQVLVNLNPQNSAASQVTTAGTTRSTPQGICVSQSLSEKANAVVRVLCGTSQFVSITPNPNARLLGSHGGAFNYVLGSGRTSSESSSGGGLGQSNDFYPGTGTVTALRIYNVDGSDGPLEVLLTF